MTIIPPYPIGSKVWIIRENMLQYVEVMGAVFLVSGSTGSICESLEHGWTYALFNGVENISLPECEIHPSKKALLKALDDESLE